MMSISQSHLSKGSLITATTREKENLQKSTDERLAEARPSKEKENYYTTCVAGRVKGLC